MQAAGWWIRGWGQRSRAGRCHAIWAAIEDGESRFWPSVYTWPRAREQCGDMEIGWKMGVDCHVEPQLVMLPEVR